jgi:transposase
VHHACVFTNKRVNRIKVLVHDGFGLRLAARRLHQSKFFWSKPWQGEWVLLNPGQLKALVLGLPWYRVGEYNGISAL